MGAVIAEDGPDAGVPWHYGDPGAEQRLLESGSGIVDLSHRGVLTIAGPDRLSWLHSLSTQHLEGLQPGESSTALLLGPTGHIEHVLQLVDDGETVWAQTEPGRVGDLVAFLESMRFMLRVEVTDRTEQLGIVWQPGTPPAGRITRSGEDSLGGYESFVPRDHLSDYLDQPEQRAGTWAYEARRIAAGVPRVFVDTDHRTIPNEIGLLGTHLEKGCYRGQETVARVHTLGRPPRRLVLLHLDGSVDALPERGAELTLGDKTVGFVGSSVRHHELGPIGLGLIKRNVPVEATLAAGEISAAQQVLVDPEVGLHVRARL
ncbi:CAF17-like 4Fe-4S cluster assembly/insertion protein YgfZ [Naumannella huperziae]